MAYTCSEARGACKGGVLINIHTSLTVRVYDIHALQTLDNRIYVCMYVPQP